MALVFGIIALLVSFFVSPIIGIIFAIVGIILGSSGIKKKDKTAIAGLVVSILTIIITLLIAFTSVGMVSSTIDNSRKDNFASVAQNYINGVRNSVLAGELECSTSTNGEFKVPAPTENGEYYFLIATSSDALTSNFSSFDSSLANKIEESTNDLMESSGKSSWDNKDVYGWVHWTKSSEGTTYYISLADVDGHGIATEAQDQHIKRVDVETKNVKADMDKALSSINNDSTYYCRLS